MAVRVELVWVQGGEQHNLDKVNRTLRKGNYEVKAFHPIQTKGEESVVLLFLDKERPIVDMDDDFDFDIDDEDLDDEFDDHPRKR